MSTPQKTFRCGRIAASVWLNPQVVNKAMVNMPSIKITKAYKKQPQDAEYAYTNSFNIEDLPAVALLAQEVYRHFRLRTSDNDNTANEENNVE